METLHAPSIAPHEDVRAGDTLPVIVPANHGLVDADAALSLIRISNVPVLAVANGFTRSPRRIVVAVDFSEASLRVARLAVELAGPNALIYLAHAISRDSALRDASTVGLSCRHNAADALLKMCAQLRLAPGVTVHRILLQGDPATELLAFATNGSAELIAIGSHGHRFVTREFVGGVATRILQHSRCSVLTVPYEVNSTVGEERWIADLNRSRPDSTRPLVVSQQARGPIESDRIADVVETVHGCAAVDTKLVGYGRIPRQ